MLVRPNDKSDPERKGQDPEPAKEVWSFPTRSRCPKCKDLRTEATSTQGRTQHRRCRMCGHRYKVDGMLV